MSDSARIDAVMARKNLRIWTILLTSSLAFLAPSAVAPGLPGLQAAFADVENAELLSRLVLTVPMLMIALSGPIVGLAVDRFGRRNVLIVCAGLYGVSGLVVLVLDSLMAIIVSRAFLGVFLAGILTSVTALIGDYFEGDERNRIAGLQGAFMSFGTLIFVVIAGYLSEIHWRVAFVLFAVAFLLIPLMLASLYEPAGSRRGMSAGVSEPLPTMQQWLGIAAVCLLAFITMVAAFMIPSQTQFFLVEIGVADPSRAGFAIGMFNFSAGCAALVYRRLRRYMGTGMIFALVFGTCGIGFVLTSLADTFTDTMIAMAIGGFSVGWFIPNVNMAIISRASMAVRGRAVGALTMSFFLGQFASPIYSVPLAKASSVGHTFALTGYWLLALAVAFVLMTVLRRIRRAA